MKGAVGHNPVPSRLTTAEVMSLARISRATLWRRISAGRLPQPVDRAREALFSEAEVHAALNAASTTAMSQTLRTEERLEMLRRRRRS